MNLDHVMRSFKKSPVRVIFGCLICLAGNGLLIWNERHAVRTAQSLTEGHDLVVAVSITESIKDENNGKVIHFSGPLSTSPPLSDTFYNVEIEAVRLKRRVQMYQWMEQEVTTIPFDSDPSSTNRETNSDVSYSYSTEWKDRIIDSNAFNIPFGHENPRSYKLKSEITTAEVVKLGQYFVSDKIVETFTSFDYFAGDEEPGSPDMKLHGGMYYHCKDIFSPKVGDIRVQFYYSGHSGETYSVIGIQKDRTIIPYTSSSGQELVLLHSGQKSPEQMFAIHHSHTRLYNWSLRMVGFVILSAALAVMNEFPYVVVSQFPLLRDVSSMSGGHFTITIAMSMSLIIIAFSWCIYRPFLALLLFGLSMLPAIKAGYFHRRRKYIFATVNNKSVPISNTAP